MTLLSYETRRQHLNCELHTDKYMLIDLRLRCFIHNLKFILDSKKGALVF